MKKIIAKIPASLQQMAIYGSALVLMKAMSLIMVPVFTHFLEPADYGRLDVLQTLANLFSIIIAFGLSDALFRFCGDQADPVQRKRTAAGIFGLAILIGGASLILTQIFAASLAELLPGGVSEVQVRLILGSLAVSGAILVPMSWLRMQDKAFAYMLASAGCAVIQAALAAVLLYLGYGIEGVLFSGLLCMSVLALILFVFQVRNTGISLQVSSYSKYGHFGSVLTFAGFSAFIIDSFPRWLLAGSVGPAEMATFALAAKIAVMAAFLTQPFNMWWMPRRFAVLSETDGLSKCARASESGITIALTAAILVSASAPLIITFMTPASYHGAIIYVPALALFMAINASIRLLNLGCLSKDRTLSPLIIDGTAAAVACIGYIFLIPLWGPWGIVSVTALVMCGQLVSYLIVGSGIRAIPYSYGKLLALAILSTMACVSMTFLSGLYSSLVLGTVAAISLNLLALSFGFYPIPAALSLRLSKSQQRLTSLLTSGAKS